MSEPRRPTIIAYNKITMCKSIVIRYNCLIDYICICIYIHLNCQLPFQQCIVVVSRRCNEMYKK